jgi:putative ABC transport system permease protein
MIGVTILTGFIAGSYPAIMISGIKPIKIFKGHLNRDSNGTFLRKILVVIQFGFSVFLIIGAVVIHNQVSYMKNIEIGYNKEQIANIHHRSGSEKFHRQFKNRLVTGQGILRVGGISTKLPYFLQCTPNNDWEGKDTDLHVIIGNSFIDYDFLETLGIELIEGRNFSREFSTDVNNFIINENLANIMGTTSAIGKRLTINEQTGEIIGVMKDFIFRRLDRETIPLAFMLGPDKVRFVSIRIKEGEIASTLSFIEQTWKQTIPMFPFNYSFLDQNFDESFRKEESLYRLLTTFTFISIFISCLGLLGLASFTIQQRTKEIGIRKVLGSSVSGIILILSKDFMKWVLLANIIASPIAFLVLNKWLQSYAHRSSIGIEVFLISLILSIVIAIITISFQSIKTAKTNPVDTLKYE